MARPVLAAASPFVKQLHPDPVPLTPGNGNVSGLVHLPPEPGAATGGLGEAFIYLDVDVIASYQFPSALFSRISMDDGDEQPILPIFPFSTDPVLDGGRCLSSNQKRICYLLYSFSGH